MAIEIFNVTNHRLSGEMLKQINEFSTDRYGGVIGSNFVSTTVIVTATSGGTTKINFNTTDSTVSLIGGGCIIRMDKTIASVSSLPASTLWYLEVPLTFSDDNITSDTATGALVKSTSATVTEDIGEFTISMSGGTYTYKGQTIYTDSNRKFMIPLCYTTTPSEGIKSIVYLRDKSSLEDWLSGKAVQDLRNEFDSRYVHQDGSTGHNLWGRVGSYDVRDFDIYRVNYTTATDDKLFSITPKSDGYTFTLPTFSEGAMYVDAQHNLNADVIPITMGGTGGADKISARQGLGIFSGSEEPSKHDFHGAVINAGDLYFRILEK